jgi:protein O-mannosyl-transferase
MRKWNQSNVGGRIPEADFFRIALNWLESPSTYNRRLWGQPRRKSLITMQRTEVKSQLLAHWKIVICAIAFLCYAQTLVFPFVYDDKFLITDNAYITSFHYLPRFFTTHLWDTYNVHFVSFYRPLLLTWSVVNHALFGFHPAGWHLTNILLHLAATYLLCVLVEKFSGDKGIAVIAGLLFAIHPVHLEVVAWASAASDMLLTIFVLASLLCYMKCKQTQNEKRWLIMAWLFYAGALLSKEPAVMMPAIIFALVWLECDSSQGFRRKTSVSFKAAAPFALMVLVYFAIRWSIFGREHYESFNSISVATMLRTIPLVICFYLKLLIFPFHLSPLYDVPDLESATQAIFILPLLLIAVIAIAIFLWWRRDHSKAIPFACLWGLWLVPALYLRSFGSDKKVGDRYVYLASAGFCILVAAVIRRIRIPTRERFLVRIAQVTATVLVSGVLILGTVSQMKYWSSDVLLFYRALEIAPKNDTGRENLAAALMNQDHFAQAIPLLLDVFKNQPQRWTILSYLGVSYYHIGDYPKSVDYLTRAIAVNPTDAREHSYMGLALLKLGSWGLAADSFQDSLRIKPEQMECHFGLGLILEHQGDWQEAMREYQAAVKIEPANLALRQHVNEFQARLNSRSALNNLEPLKKVNP